MQRSALIQICRFFNFDVYPMRTYSRFLRYCVSLRPCMYVCDVMFNSWPLGV